MHCQGIDRITNFEPQTFSMPTEDQNKELADKVEEIIQYLDLDGRMITVKYLQSITMSARMWNMIGQYRDGNGIVKDWLVSGRWNWYYIRGGRALTSEKNRYQIMSGMSFMRMVYGFLNDNYYLF